MQPTSTKAPAPTSTPSPISRLAERVKRWRATRSRGQRIPEDLWSAAVALARVHGVCPVASSLKLNYYDLQRRLGGPRRKPKSASELPTFVEVASLHPAKPDPGTVELIRSNGSRLTLRLSNPKSRDLLPLVHAFLRS
jgi:hypothetical protein